ncbi:MAG: TolC family protein [Acidobacteriaceae bacterium]|nr:TolC family protein [Acidobacteriaceae bacterium]
MHSHRRIIFGVVMTLVPLSVAQTLPKSPGTIWEPPQGVQVPYGPANAGQTIDQNKVYSLAELIDIAERNNPDTRVVWEQAKQAAAQRGIARSALYPMLAAAVELPVNNRNRVLFGDMFIRQDVVAIQPTVSLLYTIFDFGARASQIEAAEANLLAADFSFNDTHEQIIFEVTAGYYQLISSQGEVSAAEATLANARTIQEAAEERLKNGLATLPDVLEARAAAAQAAYDLETYRGTVRVAHGRLAGVLGVSPTLTLNVQPLAESAPPNVLEESVESAINRALEQRPELLAQAARIQAAEAGIKGARSQYYPTLSFSGNIDYQYARGFQQGSASATTSGAVWSAQLSLGWTIYDAGRRYNELDRAMSERRQAEGELRVLRDQAEVGVWTAYSNVQTALAQQKAAAALLDAADKSYAAAIEAYRYGVRSFLDVVAAQRELAGARTAEVVAGAHVLSEVANLAFQTGDLLHRGAVRKKP